MQISEQRLEQMRDLTRQKLREALASVFEERLSLSGSQYANEFGVLIEDGKPREFTCFPFQEEIADSLHSLDCKEVVVMKSARLGISELLNHEIERNITYEPTAVGLYRHDNASAERWVETRFEPRVKNIEALKKVTKLSVDGKRKEKKTERHFKNGAMLMVLGGDNEDNFRDHTLKKVFIDEYDAQGFAPVKNGGDKYDMAVTRVKQYWDGKVATISTPKVPADEGGRIHKLFLQSDQRHRHVKCPHCGYEFTPHWGDEDSIGGMRWDKDDPYNAAKVYYECHNPDLEERCKIQEYEKREMDAKGRWVAHNPGHYRRGYFVWQWFSPLANATWGDMVREWNDAIRKGPAAIQSFKNEVLGLPFSSVAGHATADHETLARCVTDLGVPGAEVPAWAVGLFMSVDRQKGSIDFSDSYLEAALYAVGPGRRLFQVAYWVLDAYPQKDDRCWDELERLMTRTYVDTSGRTRKVDTLAIDHNGGGTEFVMRWLRRVRRVPGRKYWIAVRGESLGNGKRGNKGIWPQSHSKKSEAVYTIDVDLAKDDLEVILAEGQIEFNANPIEGSVNLSDPAEAERFFKRMLLEKKYPVPSNPGAFKWSAPKGLGRKGNEPFDCLVYTWAMTHGVTEMPGPDRLRFRRLFEKPREEVSFFPSVPVEVEDSEVVEETPPPVVQPEPEKPVQNRVVFPKNPLAEKKAPAPGLVRVGPGFRFPAR